MASIIVEGDDSKIDKIFFDVADNSKNGEWVNFTILESRDANPSELKLFKSGSSWEKAKISFDNMEGCPKAIQKSLIQEFKVLLDKEPSLKYQILN
jgi:hypothetical protein